MKRLLLLLSVGLGACQYLPPNLFAPKDVVTVDLQKEQAQPAKFEIFATNFTSILYVMALQNEEACAGMPLKQCAKKEPLIYFNYGNFITTLDSDAPFDVNNTDVNTLISFMLDVVEDIKKQTKDGSVTFLEGYTTPVPNFDYIPTSGFLNTPFEARVKAAFPSGVYEMPKNMIKANKEVNDEFKKAVEKMKNKMEPQAKPTHS